MTQELFCYLNGKVVKESQAAVSPFDRGFLWGDGSLALFHHLAI